VIILGLSIFVVVAWRQAEGGQGCVASRCLAAVAERLLRRKPEADHCPAQPAPASIHSLIPLFTHLFID